MIGGFNNMKRRPRPELDANRTQQREIGKGISRSLQEKHRYRNFRKVVRSFCSGQLRRVQRKSEKYQASHTLQRMLCRGLRCHPPSHGLASCKQRQTGRYLRRRSHCRHDGRRQHGGRIWNPPPFFHVRKLVAQRRHFYAGQFVRQLLHERVSHPCPSSMRQHQELTRLRRTTKQRRHFSVTHRKAQLFNGCHFVAILAEPAARVRRSLHLNNLKDRSSLQSSGFRGLAALSHLCCLRRI